MTVRKRSQHVQSEPWMVISTNVMQLPVSGSHVLKLPLGLSLILSRK